MLKLKFLVAGKTSTMADYIDRLSKEKHLHVIIDYVFGLKRWCLYEELGSDLRPTIDTDLILECTLDQYKRKLLLESMSETQDEISKTINSINKKLGISGVDHG